MRQNMNSILWTAGLAVAFMAPGCGDGGGSIAGESVEFSLIEAECDGDGKKMTVTMTADVADSTQAKEIVRLDVDLDAIEVGEPVELAANPAASVTFSVVGPHDELPERKTEGGLRVFDGRSVRGTVTVDEASCDPVSTSGTVDATLTPVGSTEEFDVSVDFATP